MKDVLVLLIEQIQIAPNANRPRDGVLVHPSSVGKPGEVLCRPTAPDRDRRKQIQRRLIFAGLSANTSIVSGAAGTGLGT